VLPDSELTGIKLQVTGKDSIIMGLVIFFFSLSKRIYMPEANEKLSGDL